MDKMLLLQILNCLQDILDLEEDIPPKMHREIQEIFDTIVEHENQQLQYSADFGWGIFLTRKEEKDARE